MANVTITQLPTAGALAGTESVPIVQNGVTVQTTTGAIAATSGYTGTVTSVAATVPSFLSIAGSPITTSGTLAITYSGTALPIANGGTGSTSTTFVNLATNVTGTLPVANGGTGITSLTANYVPYGNGTGAFSSSAQFQYNGTYLLVGAASALGGLTNPVAAFTGNPGTTNYVQTYVYNAQNGASSSADLVTYTNNSTDAHGWADMGFTSQSYADATYTVTGPNEAYLFGSAPLSSGSTGNMVYATDSTGSANSHQFYVGGFTQAKGAWKMQITSTNVQFSIQPSAGGVTIPTISSTDTLTNKRITPRVLPITTNPAAPTINTDSYDMVVITGQSTTITSFTTNLTGTPVNGQKLWISITGTGAIAITWGASFEASTVALPTTTVTTARLDVGFVWNVATSKWRCVAVA